MKPTSGTPFKPPGIAEMKAALKRPKKAVVTAGMIYANGPAHLGHLAGCHIPADIFARWMRMLIGRENVLYVCGSDDHGSASELAATKAGKTVTGYIDEIRAGQKRTMDRYHIEFDIYSGTSEANTYAVHAPLCQNFIRSMAKNNMLQKKVSKQWFDPKLGRFLQDRFVNGRCPNPKCDNEKAYSDECDRCGARYEPTDLLNPKSALTGEVPELRDTVHWWLDMWKVSEPLRIWIQTKAKTWRQPVYNEVINTVMPALAFDNTHEARYKEIKDQLPPHKSKYAAGKKVQVQFEDKNSLQTGHSQLAAAGINAEIVAGWALRSISRDVAWGIPMPVDIDPEMKDKTFYVWPDSLIAPIAFTQRALAVKGRNPSEVAAYWQDPDAKVFQFLGQDNVFFYVLMQGAMWLATQKDPLQQPARGDYQMTEIFGACHLMVEGDKMSKSRGNFFTGDQLLDEKGYDAEQVRYFIALLDLADKPSNFDFKTLDERNKFLAGPMNAAFEKPISACHSKFDGKIPSGKLMEKVEAETVKVLQKYFRGMERAEYSTLLFAVENYARQINSLFTQFKPHDDRAPEEGRRDALFTCFYVLKNLMIMLYPFAPATMDRLRQSLRLPATVFCVEELGTAMPAGHQIGEKLTYFPPIAGAE